MRWWEQLDAPLLGRYRVERVVSDARDVNDAGVGPNAGADTTPGARAFEENESHESSVSVVTKRPEYDAITRHEVDAGTSRSQMPAIPPNDLPCSLTRRILMPFRGL